MAAVAVVVVFPVADDHAGVLVDDRDDLDLPPISDDVELEVPPPILGWGRVVGLPAHNLGRKTLTLLGPTNRGQATAIRRLPFALSPALSQMKLT